MGAPAAPAISKPSYSKSKKSGIKNINTSSNNMQLANVRLPLRVLADSHPWKLQKWLIQPGATVYRKQRVAVLISSETGAIDHALAPHSGTLAQTLISEGSFIPSNPDSSLAQISFCPHSIVFRGVCAICGEDAEAVHFAETPSVIESRLPVAYNSSSLSVTRDEAKSLSSLTAKRLFESGRLSLVLDLDHTLVHATDDPRAQSIIYHSPENVDKSSVSSFPLGNGKCVSSTLPSGQKLPLMYVKLRPNLNEFLKRVSEKFELHIYTMGSRPYADKVANLIDPDKKLFSARITSREDFAEGRFNQKSIDRLFPCDDSMALIVDDREDVWISATGQPYMPNLIRAQAYSFWDGLHEAYDRASSTVEPLDSVSLTKLDHIKPIVNQTKIKIPAIGLQESHQQTSSDTNQKTTNDLSSLSTKQTVNNESSNQEHISNCKNPKPTQINSQPELESEPAPAFSAELRRIVKQWWEMDASTKTQNHLLRLADVLDECHQRFFKQASEQQARNLAQNKTDLDNDSIPFKAPADVKLVLDSIRCEVLCDCVITFTGVIPTGVNPEGIPFWNLAKRLGARCTMEFENGITTHVVASQHRLGHTQKVKSASETGTAFVVTTKWLEDSALNFERQPEIEYAVLVDNRFKSGKELRNFIDGRRRDVASTLPPKPNAQYINKRASITLHDDGDIINWPKRQKFEVNGDHHSDQYNSTNGAVTKSDNQVHILSADEIGEAMDAAFDD